MLQKVRFTREPRLVITGQQQGKRIPDPEFQIFLALFGSQFSLLN
jgi:hypothetical protein